MLTLVNIFNVFKYGFTGIFLFIDSLVYWLVCKLFFLFDALAAVDFIEQADYQEIANRFYVIIGVVMLFYLTYSLLKSLINPDDLNKNMGKIVTNLVVSLVLIGIVPILFSYAFQIQNAVIKDNIIGNLVLGTDSDDNAIQDNSISRTGGAMTATILAAFLNPGGEDIVGGAPYTWKNAVGDFFAGFAGSAVTIDEKLEKNIVGEEGITWSSFMENASSGDASAAEAFFDITAFAEPISNGDAEYKPIISTICGVFLAYVLISFSIDMGVRVVKLAFYEIIAPIPILLRVVPEKKSVFDNWVKGTLATFMEVFIRVFIMFIVIFLAKFVLYDLNDWNDNGVGFIGNVIIVLGLFAFAKQAPKLISDVIGVDSGNIKLGIGGKLKGSGFLGGALAAIGGGALGFVTGGLGGMYSSAVNGAGASGFLYGATNGWKGKGMQFNKQRKGLYTDYGLKGTAGWFGGRSFFDQKKADFKTEAQNSYLSIEKGKIEKIEASKGFKDKYNELYNKQAMENNQKYQELYKKFTDNQAKFESEKFSKLKQLQEQYNQEKMQFDKDKSKKLQSLQLDFEKARRDSDITKMSQLQKQISETKSSDYANSNLSNQINQVSSSQYHNDSLENAMRNVLTIDENAIMNQTRKAYSDLNKKYKATSKYVVQKEYEKDAKKYLESAEGMKAAMTQKEALKLFDADSKGIPIKPPSGGAGGSGDKK